MDDAVAQLESLYRDLAPGLLAYFRRQRALAGAADDLLHDTFLRAIRSFPKLHNSVSPRAYLFGIARHVSLDALRAQRPTDELPADLASPASPDQDPRLDAMRAAVATLPPLLRETLVLQLQHELSYQEIAEVLDIPVGTVRSRLHNAVRQLRDALGSNPSVP